MGDIDLELYIANIHDLERQKEISFLVDTGSTRAWIPKKIADELGIQPAGMVALELADGSAKELPHGFCLFDFGGERIAGNVALEPPECEPIVGTHVLQDFRLVIDVERHTVSRARAMMAKGERFARILQPTFGASRTSDGFRNGNHRELFQCQPSSDCRWSS